MEANHYLVIDLEATCDNKNRVPRDKMEIIEIGAVLVDGATLEASASFQTFIKPVRTRTLTKFCTELTTITQSMVEEAPSFAEAMGELARFMAETRPLFCSWGDYDRKQFIQDARYHRVGLPFRNKHLNLKRAFSQQLNSNRKFGMAGALKRVGVELVGTHHRGIDDARNIAKLLPYCLGRLPFPTQPKQPKKRRPSHNVAK